MTDYRDPFRQIVEPGVFRVPCHSRVGGVNVFYPKALVYVDLPDDPPEPPGAEDVQPSAVIVVGEFDRVIVRRTDVTTWRKGIPR